MKHKKWLIAAFAFVAVVCVLMMFYFSNQDGTASHGVSDIAAYRILNLLGISPNETITAMNLCDFVVRKIAHFTEYAMLGIGLCGLLRILFKRYWGVGAVVLGAVLASLDEFHQSFTPGRTACVSDVVIDTLGILMGSLLFSTALLVWEHHQKNSMLREIRLLCVK